MRELRTIGRTFDAEIEVYGVCKYTASMKDLEDTKRFKIKNIVNWEIVNGKDAELIENEPDGTGIDEMHEYLVLHLADGNTATFRNSHVDMFRI